MFRTKGEAFGFAKLSITIGTSFVEQSFEQSLKFNKWLTEWKGHLSRLTLSFGEWLKVICIALLKMCGCMTSVRIYFKY